MTTNARVVLQDAKFAIASHSDILQSERFRISWISVVTLLRAVGHVLEKVDGKSPAMKPAIAQKWKDLLDSKPEPKIYWGFIEAERNRFLKNYEHGISRKLMIPGPDLDGGNTIIYIDIGKGQGGEFGASEKLHSILASGPFEGESEKSVAWRAYDWWVSYLDEVDRLSVIFDA